MFLAVCRAVAVEAFPVTAPSMFATKVPVEIVKSPVSDAVAVVVPTINLSALSSQAIIALSPVLPLSIMIPESLAFEAAPEFNSNKLSSKVVFVELTVVVVPLTVKLPVTVKAPPTVTLSGKPKVSVPELSPTSISFAVPEKVIVPPKDVAVDVEPSVTVILEFVKLELPIFDNVLLAASMVLFVKVSVDDAVIYEPKSEISDSVIVIVFEALLMVL